MFEWSIRVGLTEEVTLEPGLEGREETSHQMSGERLQGKGPSGSPWWVREQQERAGQVVGGGYLNFGFCTQYARSHWRV